MNYKIKLYKLPNENIVSKDIIVTEKQLKEVEDSAEKEGIFKYKIEVLGEINEKMRYEDLMEIQKFIDN